MESLIDFPWLMLGNVLQTMKIGADSLTSPRLDMLTSFRRAHDLTGTFSRVCIHSVVTFLAIKLVRHNSMETNICKFNMSQPCF